MDMIAKHDGTLIIDHDNGVIKFTQGDDPVDGEAILLRVTHLREPIPDNVLIDLVALDNLTSYTPLQGNIKTVLQIDNPMQDDRCPVCTKVHTSADYTKWGPFTFIPAHEYIIWTRNNQQTYAHRGRMQYFGRGPNDPKYQLTFNARGPERSTKGNYGGTQTLDARNIIKLEEVERDPSKRYVDEVDRDMKREDRQ
jgi:hypothetical protein